MKDKLESFCGALAKLKEAILSEPTEMNRDATIQRFEFTYELAWKTLKKVLAEKGLECLNPKDCFKGAFQQKLIKTTSEQTWLQMIKDRNLTSHIYNEAAAKKIYEKIKEKYLTEFEALAKNLTSLA